MVGSSPSCAVVFDETGGHLRRIDAVAFVAHRARHAGGATGTRVLTLPSHVRVSFTNPSRSKTALAIHAEMTSKGATSRRPLWPVKFVRDEISAPARAILQFSTGTQDSVKVRPLD